MRKCVSTTFRRRLGQALSMRSIAPRCCDPALYGAPLMLGRAKGLTQPTRGDLKVVETHK